MEYFSPTVYADGIDLLDNRNDEIAAHGVCSIGVIAMLVAAAIAIWGAIAVEGAGVVSLVGGVALATAVYGVTYDC